MSDTYVLDTTVVSALMRGEPDALARLRASPRDAVGVPQPVFAEIAYGLSRLRPSKRRARLVEKYDALRAELARVPWTDAVSDAFGRIKADLERRGERIEDFDVCIAAHAVAHGSTLATANARHMGRVRGLLVESWGRGAPG